MHLAPRLLSRKGLGQPRVRTPSNSAGKTRHPTQRERGKERERKRERERESERERGGERERESERERGRGMEREIEREKERERDIQKARDRGRVKKRGGGVLVGGKGTSRASASKHMKISRLIDTEAYN